MRRVAHPTLVRATEQRTIVARRLHAACTTTALAFAATAAQALTPLAEYAVSPDVTTELSPSRVVTGRCEIVELPMQSLVGPPSTAIAPGVNVTAFASDSRTRTVLFAVDTATTVGSVTAGPADVVRYSPLAQSIEFDSSAAGIAPGVRTDAIALTDTGDLLLSFDITVELPGGIAVDDEDLVLYDGGTFALFLDGSAAGVPREADLDAAHLLAGGDALLVSFDITGTVRGVTFNDDDVLEYTIRSGDWELALDGELLDDELVGADIDALAAVALQATTTTLPPTTTTLANPSACGDTNGDGAVTATDALFVLQAAVGLTNCDDCICDADGNGTVTASDALAVLQFAVGIDVPLDCPACD